MKLHRHLGISYNRDDGARPRAAQRVQLDDAYLGGRSGGKRGRGRARIAAVQTNEQGPVAHEAHRRGVSPKSPPGRSSTSALGSSPMGWPAFMAQAGGGGQRESRCRAPRFSWVNTILGNIKNALRGTYHAIRPKYAQRSEFEYSFQSSLRLLTSSRDLSTWRSGRRDAGTATQVTLSLSGNQEAE